MLKYLNDSLHRIIYSVDASAYRELPAGVFYPESEEDICEILKFAASDGKSITFRGAGTSLAGQVVTDGFIADLSKYLNKILEVNVSERWVWVEPGVVLDELNAYLKQYGLFFAPETSTSNRCTIGGMVGNNSCGSHSLVYGSTRDHLLEAKVFLSDGSKAWFRDMNGSEIDKLISSGNSEGKIYKGLKNLLDNDSVRFQIADAFPHPGLRRRNTGYALDELINSKGFNLCKLLAGSEGTLAVAYQLKLNLEPLPPENKVLLCAHCARLEDAFKVNLIILRHSPVAVEMMDRNILELSKNNLSQNKNRFFVKGDPAAILIAEFVSESLPLLDDLYKTVESELLESGLVYHCSRVEREKSASVWELRKAGLGLLTSMKGDPKPVSVIEDTAVIPELLPDYLEEFDLMLKKYGLSAVYHAHIGTGELHLRPVLDLKKSKDVSLFRKLSYETALLVKKYKGSLSGEHGDGRLRGEMIPVVYGEKVYELFKLVKSIFDKEGVLNRGKITETPPMDKFLRYIPDEKVPEYNTCFDFSPEGGLLMAVEQCNGSGDCRKSALFPGVMCPSYQASGDEKDTTRARANILRELITSPANHRKIFSQPDILDILDLCVSCKGCKKECPSNVDMAKYKAECLYQHYKEKGVPLSAYLISRMSVFQKTGSYFPVVYNFIMRGKFTSAVIKSIMGFSSERDLPLLRKINVRKFARSNRSCGNPDRKIYLFSDEFTSYTESHIGIKFIKLMNLLGYEVVVPNHCESGRASVSKGVLNRAVKMAKKNVTLLKDMICDETPLVGLEPGSVLMFRDEYPSLLRGHDKEDAIRLSKSVFMYDEFIMREFNKGKISRDLFTSDKKRIKLHGHCHQKALAFPEESLKMLSIPVNYTVEMIDSGCCGMAGSFGYEKRHYDFSMAIGESRLFPAIRNSESDVIISAPGTSCREQIKKGTGVYALHPVEILYDALISS
jgi:FAD/FMN-containing dehydrogenase/Fe-S oxidoreductase